MRKWFGSRINSQIFWSESFLDTKMIRVCPTLKSEFHIFRIEKIDFTQKIKYGIARISLGLWFRTSLYAFGPASVSGPKSKFHPSNRQKLTWFQTSKLKCIDCFFSRSFWMYHQILHPFLIWASKSEFYIWNGENYTLTDEIQKTFEWWFSGH